MAGPLYALNLFNVADRDEYLAYSRRSPKEVQAHGGRVIALGRKAERARIMTSAANVAFYLDLAMTNDRLAEQREQLARDIVKFGIKRPASGLVADSKRVFTSNQAAGSTAIIGN